MSQIVNDTKLDFDDVLILPKATELSSRSEVNLEVSYICLYSRREISGVPVIAANLDTVGSTRMARSLFGSGLFVCLHKYIPIEELVTFLQTGESSKSFFTIGTNTTDLDRLKSAASKCTVDKICIDVANGYMYSFLDKIKIVRDMFPNSIIMAGNVCTPEGVENIIKAGADIVKCGIGSGGLCDTRNKAGVGCKQLSVAIECGQAAQEMKALCCSDGGCKTVADICKALAAGSHFVMCGSLFCGYEECNIEWEDVGSGIIGKVYGMSSKTANDKYNDGLKEYRTSEGKEKVIEYKGSINSLIQDIKGGLASCCTYTNTRNLKNLYKNSTFIKVH